MFVSVLERLRAILEIRCHHTVAVAYIARTQLMLGHSVAHYVCGNFNTKRRDKLGGLNF